MFCGSKRPLVSAPQEPANDEAYFEYKAFSAYVANQLGFRGDDAEEQMWAMWRKYGAAGEAESPEQQAARYARADPDGEERNPGLARYQHRNPDIIVTSGMDYLAKTWNAKTFDLLQTFEGHTNFVTSVVPYHGKWLLSCSDDCSVRLWRLGSEKDGVCERTIWVSGMSSLKAMCVLPGHRCCVSGTDYFMRILSIFSGEILIATDEHQKYGPYESYWQNEGCGTVFGMLHIRDNIMASCSDDSTIRFWDVDTMRCIGIHLGHHGYGEDVESKWSFAKRYAPVWHMIHLGDGARIASCSFDRTIAIWDISDIENVKRLKELQGHDNAVMSMALLEEDILLSCAGDSTFKVWNVATGECLQTMETRGHPLCGARLNNHCAAIGGGDSTIRVFDWKTGEDLLGEGGFYAHDFSISCMARIYKAEMEKGEDEWLEPIMYRTVDPFVARIKNQEWAKTFEKHLRLQALDYSRFGEWGESFTNPAARMNFRE